MTDFRYQVLKAPVPLPKNLDYILWLIHRPLTPHDLRFRARVDYRFISLPRRDLFYD